MTDVFRVVKLHAYYDSSIPSLSAQHARMRLYFVVIEHQVSVRDLLSIEVHLYANTMKSVMP